MSELQIKTLTPSEPAWPATLAARLGAAVPKALQAAGSVALLDAHKTALFCSSRTPGAAILRAYDTARQLRDQGMTVISGFHSPIEQQIRISRQRQRKSSIETRFPAFLLKRLEIML